MNFITKEEFKKNANENMGNHWKSWENRWKYFNRTVEIVKSMGIDNPKQILEMGTMGATVVPGCDTIDYGLKWNFKGKNPTYLHDARSLPWPIEDKKYELFISLRVIQHLNPVQKECFLESKRISNKIIIVVPEIYSENRGIKLDDFISWNNKIKPTLCEKIYGRTYLYFWESV